MNYRTIILGVAGLMALSSCTKEEAPPAKPYFQFTADDRAWLLASPPTEWVFENARGQQRRYRLNRASVAIFRIAASPACAPNGWLAPCSVALGTHRKVEKA